MSHSASCDLIAEISDFLRILPVYRKLMSVFGLDAQSRNPSNAPSSRTGYLMDDEDEFERAIRISQETAMTPPGSQNDPDAVWDLTSSTPTLTPTSTKTTLSPQGSSNHFNSAVSPSTRMLMDEEDEELRRALELSIAEKNNGNNNKRPHDSVTRTPTRSLESSRTDLRSQGGGSNRRTFFTNEDVIDLSTPEPRSRYTGMKDPPLCLLLPFQLSDDILPLYSEGL
jgi:hypothetical protein